MTGIFKKLSRRVDGTKGGEKAPVRKRLYSQGLTDSELRRMFLRSR